MYKNTGLKIGTCYLSNLRNFDFFNHSTKFIDTTTVTIYCNELGTTKELKLFPKQKNLAS